MYNKNIPEKALASLKRLGAEEASASLTYKEVHELTLDEEGLSMLRTNWDYKLALEYIRDKKRGVTVGNQLDEASLFDSFEQCKNLCESGKSDEANTVAPFQAPRAMTSGKAEPDTDAMCKAIKDFSEAVKSRYPTVNLRDTTLSFASERKHYANSNQTALEAFASTYEFSCTFLSKKGGKTSSFNYSGLLTQDLSTPLLEQGMFKILLKEIEEQRDTAKLDGSFEGDIIFTPPAVADFISEVSYQLGDRALISGSSVFKDKLGETVTAPGLTMRYSTTAPELCYKEFITGDGFVNGDAAVIEHGVLKSFLLSLRGSIKTGKARAENYGQGLIIEAGDRDLEALIKSVKKGILLSRFSGDSANDNGDFSGVAKNSYYIEDGKIKFPVSEVMVAGNLKNLLLNIEGISRERINFGYQLVPWIKSSGFTVSGK